MSTNAYDRMDWNYLRAVMNKMGFHERWIHWMSMCVESVDYSVIVNGSRLVLLSQGGGSVKGILSLHICLLFVPKDYLRLSVMQRLGMPLRAQRFVVKHRRFPTCCLLMIVSCFSKLLILSTYELASGQAISLPKSEIYCSRNVPDDLKANITAILGVQVVLGTGKYLGLPSMIGRDRKATFAYIKRSCVEENQLLEWQVSLQSRARGNDKICLTGNSFLCDEYFPASYHLTRLH